jgi:hypothetical protein
MPLGHAEVGAIEAAGAHPNQHLGALRDRLGDFGDGSAAGAINEGFHGITFLIGVMRSGLFGGFTPVAGHHGFARRPPSR